MSKYFHRLKHPRNLFLLHRKPLNFSFLEAPEKKSRVKGNQACILTEIVIRCILMGYVCLCAWFFIQQKKKYWSHLFWLRTPSSLLTLSSSFHYDSWLLSSDSFINIFYSFESDRSSERNQNKYQRYHQSLTEIINHRYWYNFPLPSNFKK